MSKSYSRLVVRGRVVVNLQGGKAIEGVIWDEGSELLVLKGAVLHDPSATAPVPLDGEVIVERARIDFVQVVTA